MELALAAASLDQTSSDVVFLDGMPVYSEKYEAAWSILQATSMDLKYLATTEYNFFDLIRHGNTFWMYELVST